jgi:hypothetical protein
MELKSVQNQTRRARFVPAALLFVAALPAAILRGQAPAPPVDPTKLPARDEHQGLLIAADPYLTSERSEEKFGKKHPYAAGVLAVEVYLRNNTDSPIQVSLTPIELNVTPPGQPRQSIEALSSVSAARRIVNPGGPNPTAKRVPLPGAAGGSDKKAKEVAKLADALAPQMLGDIVGPHGTIHGFLFFDVGAEFGLVAHSTLYFPEVRKVNPEEHLLFFEVDLGAATK